MGSVSRQGQGGPTSSMIGVPGYRLDVDGVKELEPDDLAMLQRRVPPIRANFHDKHYRRKYGGVRNGEIGPNTL